MNERMNERVQMVRDRLPMHNSRRTVERVFERNKSWENMLVVADLTGSMTPYTRQLLLRFKLNAARKAVKHFMFFNDGDMKPDRTKRIAPKTRRT